jgi:Fic family protein
MFQFPENKTELDEREAAGLWKAIGLTKTIGESNNPIDNGVLLFLHKNIFEQVNPDIAGRFRIIGEDIKKLKCVEPPTGSLVHQKMYEMEKDLAVRLSGFPKNHVKQSKKEKETWFRNVIDLAAWIQYKIAAIHPFCDGNGRVARLMTNVILRRYELPPSQLKYEGDHKTKYTDALCQIDNHLDYEPLKRLIARSVLEAYKKEEKLRRNTQGR